MLHADIIVCAETDATLSGCLRENATHKHEGNTCLLGMKHQFHMMAIL
jgi:hypothetical protein